MLWSPTTPANCDGEKTNRGGVGVRFNVAVWFKFTCTHGITGVGVRCKLGIHGSSIMFQKERQAMLWVAPFKVKSGPGYTFSSGRHLHVAYNKRSLGEIAMG